MAGREARPPLPVGPFYVKGCRLLGFVMFKASAHEQAAAAADINRWLAAGRLRAPVDRVVTLAHVAEAHALQEAATVEARASWPGRLWWSHEAGRRHVRCHDRGGCCGRRSAVAGSRHDFRPRGCRRKIVYVCDRSASMAEPAGVPLAEAKRELLASIAALGDSRQFHLIFTTSDRACSRPPAAGAGPCLPTKARFAKFAGSWRRPRLPAARSMSRRS